MKITLRDLILTYSWIYQWLYLLSYIYSRGHAIPQRAVSVCRSVGSLVAILKCERYCPCPPVYYRGSVYTAMFILLGKLRLAHYIKALPIVTDLVWEDKWCGVVADGWAGASNPHPHPNPLTPHTNIHKKYLKHSFFHFLTRSPWTNGWTNGPTDRRTKPFIELRVHN